MRNTDSTLCAVLFVRSAIDEHDKAVQWFKRALRIDRKCLPAWTLLGHEFVEMRNSGKKFSLMQSIV